MWRPLQRKTLTAALAAALVVGGAVAAVQAQAPNPAPSSLTETYGDWAVRCVTPAAEESQTPPARICEMVQELRQQDTGQRLVAAALQTADAGASLTLVAPFGLLLSDGVRIDVDGKALTEGDFRTCLPGGCLSLIALDETAVGRLAAGKVANLTMRAASGQDVSVSLSLSGFTAAWNRLRSM